jgi:hypothetical protein
MRDGGCPPSANISLQKEGMSYAILADRSGAILNFAFTEF